MDGLFFILNRILCENKERKAVLIYFICSFMTIVLPLRAKNKKQKKT